MLGKADLRVRKLPPDCTIDVTVYLTSEFRLRRWIAIQLFRLGGWVLGAGIEIVEKAKGER